MSKFCEWNEYLKRITNQKSLNEYFVNFMILWMAYNHYYNSLIEIEPELFSTRDEKKKDSEKAIVIYKKEDLNLFYEQNKDEILRDFQNIPAFRGLGIRNSVVDTRFNDISSDRNAYFNENANDLKHFLKAVYQIRCNLFHGDKTPYESTDKALVVWAYNYLLLILHRLEPCLFTEYNANS